MPAAEKQTQQPPHRVMRELYRHYLEFRDIFQNTGKFTIEHGDVTLSLWDLQDGLASIAPRKREAVFYNVILDKRQKDVAEIMGITTVSVGQYVESAMIQLAAKYFTEDEF